MILNKLKELFSPKNKTLQLYDVDNNLLAEGDIVLSLRYNIGRCRLILEEEIWMYQPLEGGEKIPYYKMIDAATERQKVKKEGTSY